MYDPHKIEPWVSARAARALTRIIYERLEGAYDPEEGPTYKQVDEALDTLLDDVMWQFKKRLRDHL